MNRTLGFFLGSAVVFGMLVLILGQPVSLAPPVDRNPDLRAGKTIQTAPIRIPAPRIAPEQPLQAATPQQDPTASAPAPIDVPAAAGASTETVAEAANTTLPPVNSEVLDENQLAEQWLAAMPLQSESDDTHSTLQPPGETISPDAVIDAATLVPQAPQLEWFPLWDPFHSELSANAFARRLERITGLDYRVIKTNATEYRVAVGYSSEEQRQANVIMIEEATGLSITGGSL